MERLLQIVCVDSAGELPCALSPFLPESEAVAQLREFQDNGHGARAETRPILQYRDHAGRVVDLEAGTTEEPTRSAPSKISPKK